MPTSLGRWSVLLCGSSLLGAASFAPLAGQEPAAVVTPSAAALPAAYLETLPGTRVSIRMVPIPPADGKPGFWLSECEITWDAYDLFIFGIDGARDREGDAVDAYTRPSKPYIPPDRGFGHEGYPVISSSFKNAKQFCRWLSAKTRNGYRLPTVAEWRYAAGAGSTGKWCFGDDPAQLGDYAWFDGNADWTTHPVRKKKPNAWGVYDAHGNAGEWCVEVGKDGKRRVVLCGGTFEGQTDEVTLSALERPEERWQMSDPQIPKSKWWLSDAPFAGLRILRPFPVTEVETDAKKKPGPDSSGKTSEQSATVGSGSSPQKEER